MYIPNLPKIEYAKRYFMYIEQQDYKCIPIEHFLGMTSKFPDRPPGVIGYLVKKAIINKLQMEDFVYYYINFKQTGWWKDFAAPWDHHANLPKYFKEKIPGTSLSEKIYQHALNDPRQERSAMVTAMPLEDIPPEEDTHEVTRLKFNYAKFTDLIKFHNRNGGLFTSWQGEQEIGFPQTLYQLQDVF